MKKNVLLVGLATAALSGVLATPASAGHRSSFGISIYYSSGGSHYGGSYYGDGYGGDRCSGRDRYYRDDYYRPCNRDDYYYERRVYRRDYGPRYYNDRCR